MERRRSPSKPLPRRTATRQNPALARTMFRNVSRPEKRLEVNFEDLKNPELQEKLRNAQTTEDLIALAREEGSSSPTSSSRPWPAEASGFRAAFDAMITIVNNGTPTSRQAHMKAEPATAVDRGGQGASGTA